MNEFTAIIDLINDSDLITEEKNLLLAKLQDSNLSDEAKTKFVVSFIEEKKSALDQEESTITGPIYDEADVELAQAEKEYNVTMKELEEEARKINEETDAELASIPNQDI